ncbi:unnamed protein product [Colias eurytheme]|nr:unnamed protein product [Colias eurytheme]
MPLKRTPPSTPAAAVHSDVVDQTYASTSVLTVPIMQQTLHHCSSEPSLTKKTNVTFRKRKHTECDEDKLESFMLEIKQMFMHFKEEQNKSFEKLCETVENMRTSFEFLAEKCDSLSTRVNKLELARGEDAKYIKTLEEKLEISERASRSTCLEIRNIPNSSSESKNYLLDTFLKTTNVLKIDVQPHEVKDIYRIKSKDPNSRTIIVDLTSCLLKEKIINLYRNFNKGPSKLTTEHLHLKGPPKNIFISENLTAKMKRLFFLSRDLANTHNFKFCWVSHGKIFLRKKENGPLIRIRTELDIAKVKQDII